MKRRLANLRLESYSDRELLLLMKDLRDENGHVQSEEIADRLDLDHPKPLQCVGIRMAWMRRYGVVDFQRQLKVWYLTSKGEAIANGGLTKAQTKALESISAERGMEAVMALGSRYREFGEIEATMMRRAWKYSVGR